MSEILTLFPTRLYRAELDDPAMVEDLARTSQALSVDDEAGLKWCRKNGYPGYTSYASLNDLPWRFPEFKALAKQIDPHVRAFARLLEFDLGGGKLAMDSFWVNILPEGGFHAAHIHPHSVISGTFYVAVPKGASALRLEDPRHAMMMAAPPRKAKAALENRAFVSIEPKPGTLLLWESWLRHDVPMNRSAEERISVSFNYNWV
ncbi:MAG: TIGR02466 family protein [Beijerinckiaceae bacterium]|nr:TIGR02466 family protein [Beijerinckiaceae bacterium]MCZ8301125.1 TIGR02466 family protein [Beijerinckiaceae bacterium]